MAAKEQGYIGVDLDGTLAHYDGWKGPDDIGKPVPTMVERVKQWISEGKEVRIVTARLAANQDDEDAYLAMLAIDEWCLEHIGQKLIAQSEKDHKMICLYDDRCVRVETNTGRILSQDA